MIGKSISFAIPDLLTKSRRNAVGLATQGVPGARFKKFRTRAGAEAAFQAAAEMQNGVQVIPK